MDTLASKTTVHLKSKKPIKKNSKSNSSPEKIISNKLTKIPTMM